MVLKSVRFSLLIHRSAKSSVTVRHVLTITSFCITLLLLLLLLQIHEKVIVLFTVAVSVTSHVQHANSFPVPVSYCNLYNCVLIAGYVLMSHSEYGAGETHKVSGESLKKEALRGSYRQ